MSFLKHKNKLISENNYVVDKNDQCSKQFFIKQKKFER